LPKWTECDIEKANELFNELSRILNVR